MGPLNSHAGDEVLDLPRTNLCHDQLDSLVRVTTGYKELDCWREGGVAFVPRTFGQLDDASARGLEGSTAFRNQSREVQGSYSSWSRWRKRGRGDTSHSIFSTYTVCAYLEPPQAE